jgi:hypothetical protein
MTEMIPSVRKKSFRPFSASILSLKESIFVKKDRLDRRMDRFYLVGTVSVVKTIHSGQKEFFPSFGASILAPTKHFPLLKIFRQPVRIKSPPEQTEGDENPLSGNIDV